MLLERTDAEAARHEEKIGATRRQASRLELALEELRKRLAESEEQEAQDALSDRIRETHAARERALELYREYEAHAQEIAKILDELERIENRRTMVFRDAQGFQRHAEVAPMAWTEQGAWCATP